ncbi:MAG TPA: amino acid adenylation domain-containing protein, partial [Reyranella sp.]
MKVQPFSAEKRSLIEKLLKEQEVPQQTKQPPVRDPRLEGKDAFVLSFSQRRLWFLDQLEPGSAFYNFPLAVPFNLAVNATVLQRSINEIVCRHEALRTVFDQVDGEPVQIVLSEMSLPLDVVDLRMIDKESQNAELTRLAAELAQRPFDLASGPLLRTTLLRRGPEDNVFLLVMHHIVSDGWSLGVFWRELVALYNAFYVSRPSPLPELPIQYADFAVWQRDRLQGERLAALLSYWREQLGGIPTLQLPTDRPRPAVPTYRGAFHEISIPRPLNDALRALAQREGATLFMTLFAAFTVLLQRYTGQEDVVVGSYVAGRDRAELEGLIGFFINSLVLRADLSGDPSFRTLLARVREMALDAYAHQELPFEKLVEELQPERDLGRNPLFQVSFQLFSAQLEGSTPGGPEGAPTIDLNRGMAIFDIAVNIWDGPDGLSGHVEYSTDLFEHGTIARLIDHYRTLLKSVVAEPDAQISTLAMLGEAEQHRVLAGWNDTRRDFAADCIHELFERQVERSPDDVAIACDGHELTYAELNRRANRLARGLRRSGLERGAPVGLCVGRSAHTMVAVLAVLKAGGAFVPLDPSYPTERLEFMLKDSGARIVVLERATAARLAVGGATTILLDDENAFAGESEANLALALTGDDLCYLLYTSGSTGRPKGVLGMHRGTTNRLHWMWEAYPFEPGEVLCQKTALSFVDSIWEMFGGLLQGVKTVVLGDAKVADPRLLVKTLAAARVTRIVMVPSLLRAIMASGIDLAGALPTLKYWTLSGEALPYDLCVDFRQDLPHARLLNLYGSSEVAADVLCCDLSKVQAEARAVPIGRPIANTQAYILNSQRNPVPIGVPGELYVGGHAVARGYHERPELTGESFVRNPFGDGMLYRTRDQVRYRHDGEIEYLGRLDHQVKIRGYRIELGEIEAALEQHEWIDAAAASVVQSGGDPRLVAYVVAEPEAMSSADGDQTGELASRWRSVWNDTYRGGNGGDFDTVGWNSSYSSEPLSAAEMREWVEQTVGRVASLRPRRVLEIGCGTGMLLLRLAGQCAEYVATDFSPVALEKVRREIASKPNGYRNVTLFERAATDFADVVGPFDLVILNSVIQYFPSIDYLFQVLRGVLTLTTPDARIFIGDVRSQPLLEAFHASVELAHAADSLPSAALRARIHKQVAVEKELAVDPKVFHALGPDIAQVTV